MVNCENLLLDVDVKRTDSVENDVSASTCHLNKCKEVRKHENRKDHQLQVPCENAATPCDLQDGDVVEDMVGLEGIDDLSRSISVDHNEGNSHGEHGKLKVEIRKHPTLMQQSNLIKAERTDNASWDAEPNPRVGGRRPFRCVLC